MLESVGEIIKKRKINEEDVPSKFSEASGISKVIDTNQEKDGFIILNDSESTIKLKVSKSLLSKESDVFKQLFDGNEDNEIVEINEEYAFQLATLMKSLHAPFTPPHTPQWNDVEARLVCKYLITSRLQYWAELSNDLLATLAGLHIEIFAANSSVPKGCVGVFKCKGSYYEKQDEEKFQKIKHFDTSKKWLIYNTKSNIIQPYVITPKYDVSYQDSLSVKIVLSETMFFSDRFLFLRQSDDMTMATIKFHDSTDTYNLSKEQRSQTNASDAELFWTIVETVLTHDGLKFADGVLRNEQYLMGILLVRKFPHLWVIDKMVKYFDSGRIAQLFYSAGLQTHKLETALLR